MKSLIDFINEQLINEMSPETYKKAADKARQIGDPRWEKFLDAYAKELKKVDDKAGETNDKKVFKWYQEDKQFFRKLKQKYPNTQNAAAGMNFYDKDETAKIRMELNTDHGYEYDKARLFLVREWPTWSGEEKPSSVEDGDRLLICSILDYEGSSLIRVIYDVDKDALVQVSDTPKSKINDRVKEIAAELIGWLNSSSKYADPENIKKVG